MGHQKRGEVDALRTGEGKESAGARVSSNGCPSLHESLMVELQVWVVVFSNPTNAHGCASP